MSVMVSRIERDDPGDCYVCNEKPAEYDVDFYTAESGGNRGVSVSLCEDDLTELQEEIADAMQASPMKRG